ncbi:hypothetical protein KIN20_002591 [Parelaphostrongylus tenuis]|uniref:Acetyl-CoA hydrolase/transferase C-terminal domain-containing protein n=1 Tax=Parelaphostrongylus tenuis TaxID=148309 RepID=A0AAD5QHW0_PARTN|nr:hypothetical protein KIN20_002591 [Parelaphostrongylus tenuis]
MFSDGVLDLVACNAITNRKKVLYPGKLVVSFVYGSTKLYNFLHDNPMVEFRDVQWTNDPAIIRRNPKVTAINSAVEIDLTGQGKVVVSLPSRSHVHYVVTEHGIAQLWGKNMRQRAYELIKIAHPSQREFLEKSAFERLRTRVAIEIIEDVTAPGLEA